jgi:hypothetical protein
MSSTLALETTQTPERFELMDLSLVVKLLAMKLVTHHQLV